MRIGSAIASSMRHIIGVGLQAFLIAAIVVALAFAAAVVVGSAPAGGDTVFAAKGGNGNGNGGNGGKPATTSSISLNEAGQALSLGSSVTFTTTVGDLTGTEYPLVYLACYSTSSGALVYGQLDLPGTVFVLGGGSSDWWQVGGPANCVAHLYAYGTHGGQDTIRELATPAAFSTN
ncbi:MAG: hypothetical protein C0498_10500 [Anaerolinea sp.]|jgi:hypothetical protein|nr:hypothetical protein [Anaerolinea sp.]